MFYKQRSLMFLCKRTKKHLLLNGFRNVVARNFQKIDDRSDKGPLLGNIVFCDLLKGDYNVKYWRTKSQAEVDFIIEEGKNIIPVEVKSFLAKPVLSRSIINFLQKYKSPAGIVFSTSLIARRDLSDKKIIFLPHFLNIPKNFPG